MGSCFPLTSTAKLLETEAEPRQVVKILMKICRDLRQNHSSKKCWLHSWNPRWGFGRSPCSKWGIPGQDQDACDAGPTGHHADGAVLLAPGTTFTFFVLGSSASEDSASFSCLAGDEVLSSMPSCSSFPALPKKNITNQINGEQWQRREGAPREKTVQIMVTQGVSEAPCPSSSPNPLEAGALPFTDEEMKDQRG